MNLKFLLGWFLFFALSVGLDGWAFEEGSPSQRDARWQEFMEQGKRDREQRRLADAEQNFLATVSAAEQFEAGYTRCAASLNGLAITYHEQGRYTDAEVYYHKALNLWESALGPENETVAICLSNLARLEQDRGQFGQAEVMFRRALAIEEKLFGAGHLEQAKSLDFLGDLYSAQGLYRQAEPYYRQSLAIREKTLQADDPRLATSFQ